MPSFGANSFALSFLRLLTVFLSQPTAQGLINKAAGYASTPRFAGT